MCCAWYQVALWRISRYLAVQIYKCRAMLYKCWIGYFLRTLSKLVQIIGVLFGIAYACQSWNCQAGVLEGIIYLVLVEEGKNMTGFSSGSLLVLIVKQSPSFFRFNLVVVAMVLRLSSYLQLVSCHEWQLREKPVNVVFSFLRVHMLCIFIYSWIQSLFFQLLQRVGLLFWLFRMFAHLISREALMPRYKPEVGFPSLPFSKLLVNELSSCQVSSAACRPC